MKRLFLILLIAAIIICGFIRDWTFVSMNARIDKGETTLILYKWILSFVFSAIFYLLTILTLKNIFNNFFLKITVGCFLSVIFVAALFHLLGNKPLSVLFMHMVQSPIILMVLVPALYLLKSEKK